LEIQVEHLTSPPAPLHHGEGRNTASRICTHSGQPSLGIPEGAKKETAGKEKGGKPLTSGVTALQHVDDFKKGQARWLRKEGSTAAERILWERLRDRRVAGLKFRRQQVIDGFITDFYCEPVNVSRKFYL
jgi:hypothetical protein